MKGITVMTLSMGKVYSPGLAVTSIKAITLKMRGTDLARCYGLTVASTKENGPKEFSMELVE